MKKFDSINTDNIINADIGDVFIGYGYTTLKRQGDVVLTYKDIEERFAIFHFISKSGKQLKLNFTWLHGTLSKVMRI